MQVFFSSLCELDSFTRRLKALPQSNACEYCKRNDQWVSHGYVYKQRSIDKKEVVGKRILCGRRFGAGGCGRTRQLYLHTVIPNRHYFLGVVLAFIAALVNGSSMRRAWCAALGHDLYEPRQAWRWVLSLMQRLSRFRGQVCLQDEVPCASFSKRSHRLQILLPTLKALLKIDGPQSRFQFAML